jgi:hypothetical protein
MTQPMLLISILLEMVVAALGIALAIRKKKKYGWFIALTFILYIFYDLANLFPLTVSKDFLSFIFFAATASILWAIWNIFLEA